MTDYEALGKYTEAREALSNVLLERDNILRQLSSLVSLSQGGSYSSGSVFEFDVQSAKDMLSSIAEIETKIHSLINTINSNADKCGKTRILSRPLPKL